MNFVEKVKLAFVDDLKARFVQNNVVKSFLSFKNNGHRMVLSYENGQFQLLKVANGFPSLISLDGIMVYDILKDLKLRQEDITYMMTLIKKPDQAVAKVSNDLVLGGVL